VEVTHEEFINLLMLSCFGDMLLEEDAPPEIKIKLNSKKIDEIFTKLHMVLFKSDISGCYQCELQEIIFDEMMKDFNE